MAEKKSPAGRFDVSVDDAAGMRSVFVGSQHQPRAAVAAAIVGRTADLAGLGGTTLAATPNAVRLI